MKFNSFRDAAILSFLFPIAAAQTSSSGPPQGNCTIFNWADEYIYTRYTSAAPQRISSAQYCPPRDNTTHACSLIADGDLSVSFLTNTSFILRDQVWNTPNGPESHLHSLIRSTINATLAEQNVDFNRSVIGIIDQVVPLAPGNAGYLNFLPLLRCVVGTMSNCTGGLEDGFGIEACAPVANVDGGLRILSGKTTIQNVSQEDVGSFRDPFGNQSRGRAGKSVVLEWSFLIVMLSGVGGVLLL